jgi:ABC-2 type transport system permease protein
VAARAPLAPGVRSGLLHWLRSYLLMTRWELTNMRLFFLLIVLVQLLIGAGFAAGMGLLFGDQVPPRVALFLSTGVPVVTLITVGLVLGPQLVAQQKMAQTYDFMWSLPVPRSAAAAAWFTVTAGIGLPGMAVALVVASLRYDLDLAVSPAIAPAVFLTLLAGTLVGYALAHAIPNPMVTQLATQILIFVILGFSPINYPIDQLPDWFAAIHRGLPFHHMAVVVRDGLTVGLVTDVATSYLVLAAWTAGAAALAAWVLGRRS